MYWTCDSSHDDYSQLSLNWPNLITIQKFLSSRVAIHLWRRICKKIKDETLSNHHGYVLPLQSTAWPASASAQAHKQLNHPKPQIFEER